MRVIIGSPVRTREGKKEFSQRKCGKCCYIQLYSTQVHKYLDDECNLERSINNKRYKHETKQKQHRNAETI